MLRTITNLGLHGLRSTRKQSTVFYIFLLTVFVHAVPSYAAKRKAPTDAELIAMAGTACKNAKKPVNVPLLQRLLDLEREHKVPAYAKGITLAAACRESGYRAKPRRGDGGKAVGILQMWPWWERKYKIDRENVDQSVKAWLTQINRSVSKAKRKCKRPWRPWLIAQAWIGSGPQKWRCRYSRHYRLLRYWKWKLHLTKKRKTCN